MARRTTPEFRRRMVYAYIEQPFGSKARWLKENQCTVDQIRYWRYQLLYGDIEANTAPRTLKGLTMTHSSELKRLRAELQQAEADNKHLLKRLEKSEHDNETLGKTVTILGKAIDAMRKENDD